MRIWILSWLLHTKDLQYLKSEELCSYAVDSKSINYFIQKNENLIFKDSNG